MAEQFKINITNIIWSFDRENHQVNLLLVQRAEKPFAHFWGLPETVMRTDESADEAALRLVREKIGLKLASFHTEQLATFTHPERTPGQRTLSLAYMTFLPEMPALTPGYGATDAEWFSMASANERNTFTNGKLTFETTPVDNQTNYYVGLPERTPDPQTTLAFDHDWILKIACDRIANKLDYQPNVLLILGSSFTLKQARQVFAVFKHLKLDDIDNSNFKKNHRHIFEAVGTAAQTHPGRPAKVFRLRYL
ncbi:NUDIX family hydrolase [Secundilactobacillus pentosiphilus]|uniref:NUDIX family hydrolase n=1 Tax=Secundilactobacillus pentosiphilus TaxID=1714682 RepID=A0A1Z5ITU0_9LACO|nr:NUDIX domain-containing protein [Secundilactobacillus pentosiphilus]GAX05164.1 NUDIX family hydrolase [Secundilactobacillus pentosiphilus]